MISKLEPDGTYVTTPVYIGPLEGLKEAKACDDSNSHRFVRMMHKKHSEIHQADNEEWVAIEECEFCGMIRARHGENKAALERIYQGSNN